MLKIVKQKSVITWPVRLAFPIDGGDIREDIANITFHRRDDEYMKALRERVQRLDMDDISVKASNADFFADLVAGWSDGEICDEDGTLLSYSVNQVRIFLTGEDGYVWSRGLNAALNQIAVGERAKK